MESAEPGVQPLVQMFAVTVLAGSQRGSQGTADQRPSAHPLG